MGIKDVFNFLILALSLSTVLLTLLSFFIFKIRQVQTMRARRSEVVLETAFFRRYAPKIAIQNKSTPPISSDETAALRWHKRIWYALRERYPSFFGGNALIFTSCTLALFMAFVVNELANQGELDADRVTIAHRAKELKAKGLLDRRQFDPFVQNPKLQANIPRAPKANLDATSKLLQDLRFLIVRSETSLKFNHESHEQAVRLWEAFLHELGAKHVETLSPFQLSSRLTFSRRTLIILPHAEALNGLERDALERAFAAGVGALAIGPVGILNGKGEQAPDSWTERWFGASFSKSFPQPQAGADAPWAMWSSDSPITIDLPPSIQLPSTLVNRDVKTVDGQSLLWTEATAVKSTDEVARKRSFGHIASVIEGRRLWLAFGPETIEEVQDMDRFHLKAVLVRSLAWLGHQPLVALAPWKSAVRGAVSVALSGSEGAALDALVEQATADQLPFTVFMTPGKRSRWSSLPEWMTSPETSPELRVPDAFHPWTPPDDLFELLQSRRLTIERRSERPVKGLHVDRKTLTPQELNAIKQNEFDYVLSPFPRTGGHPVSVGGMTVLPAMPVDDAEISSRIEVGSVGDAAASLLKEVDLELARSGFAMLVLHDHISGVKPFRHMLNELSAGLKRREAWLAPIAEIAHWWRSRQEISIRYERKANGPFTLVVENTGATSVSDLVLLAAAAFESSRLPSSAGTQEGATQERYSVLSRSDESTMITIRHLEAGESLRFNLENQE